jgi:hypothetical protein
VVAESDVAIAAAIGDVGETEETQMQAQRNIGPGTQS